MKIQASVLLVIVLSVSLFAQQSADDRRANTPIEPFQIIGNIYYVGAAEVTSFLITSPKGHILIDGGYAETVPQIKANLTKLGFNLHDIKYLLNTQAHFDHAGGLNEVKKLTNAKMLASAADKVLLESGGKGDFAFGDRLTFTPVMVDRVIKDGETIKLGNIKLKTILMPGHTKGSTAWSMEITDAGRKLNVLFLSSTTSPTYRFYNNAGFPDIISEYEKTFTRLKTLTPDVFLASHGSFFNLLEKAERRSKDKTNPFIEQETYKTYIADTEKDFREKLVKQRQEEPVK
jgi:metallo-beta-lactamase class B